MNDVTQFNGLIGKIVTRVINIDNKELIFVLDNGTYCKFYHRQQASEQVRINDICGDLDDLINSPILTAECISNSGGSFENCDTHTWTFYKFSTVKGFITIRWYGESNGYYSEKVNFVVITPISNDTVMNLLSLIIPGGIGLIESQEKQIIENNLKSAGYFDHLHIVDEFNADIEEAEKGQFRHEFAQKLVNDYGILKLTIILTGLGVKKDVIRYFITTIFNDLRKEIQ